MNSPWRELGLPGPSDTETIKRAYAQRLKEVHPEEDPEGFQALHRAYQMARRMATDRRNRRPMPVFQEPEGRSEPQETPTESEGQDGSALEDQEEPPEHAGPEELDFSALEDQAEEDESQSEDWDFEELLEEEEPEDRPPPEELPHQAEEYETVWGYHRKKRGVDKIMLLIAALLMLLVVGRLALPEVLNSLEKNTYPRTILQQMEEDWGVEIVSSPNNDKREELRYLYWLEDNPEIRFQAIYRGGRDMEAGQLGYDTNYPNVRLFWRLRDFAAQWPAYSLSFNVEQTDHEGEGASGGSPPSLFVFQMPMHGGEDFVQALGDELEAVSQESWYQKQMPEFRVYLVYRDSIIINYNSTTATEPCTGETLLLQYEEQSSLALLHSILYYDGVVYKDFPDADGSEVVRSGQATFGDDDYWMMVCWDRDGSGHSIDYLLRKDLTALYCQPSLYPGYLSDLAPAETVTLEDGTPVTVYRLPE
ncbi:hypothetical protein ACTQ33_00505 [Candidatus Avoscillospira sp. LCP25S3_F1]|uniref:hypothetical protein n=1 Tax=Candidatus Avoscillospira sp. LCP25S3_F1 TaxID=3438825 RepID=UPI003F918C6B